MASLADRLAPTAGQSRPSSSSGRGGRPTGPARTASAGGRASPRGQQRSAPYAKTTTPVPAASSSNSARGTADVDSKWEHDLFSAESDLYAPQLNTSFGKAKRSVSGSVFGRALDGISSTSLNARAATKSPPLKSPSADLFGRFGLESPVGAAPSTSNGSFSPASTETSAKEREERLRQKAQWEAQLRAQDDQKKLARQQERERELREQAEQRRREELLRQEELDLQLPRREVEEQERKASQATTVVIENLVDGTTPEDVKAALGDFGEILTCKVLDSNGDTVSMQLEFTNRAEAQSAVNQLNGALADGKTLRLTIKERPAAPPKAMGMNLKGTKIRQENQRSAAIPTGPRNNGTPANRRQQNGRQPEQTRPQEIQTSISAKPEELESKLRSDRVATYDPRAEVIDRPAPQQFAKQSKPKTMNPSNPHTTSASPSIAHRFGFPNLPAGNQHTQQRPQGRQNNNSGLLGRLGGTAPNDDTMMDTS